MRVLACSSIATLILLAASQPWAPEPEAAGAPDISAQHDSVAAPTLPFAFEPNAGQFDARIRYVARGSGYSVFLTDTGAVFSLSPATRGTGEEQLRPATLQMTLAGARQGPRTSAHARLPGATSYLLGADPARWQRNVPRYGEVRFEDVYAGIDAVYYGRDGRLEYDFVVAPGVDPGQIALDFHGADGLAVDATGDLLVGTAHGTLRQARPVVYQVVDGVRRSVSGAYRLVDGDTVGFVLGVFDAALPLVIDPVVTYSTYLGGDGYDNAEAVAVDAAGNTWVAGYTNSEEFDWQMPNDSEYAGGSYDAYVCRFTAVGAIPLCAYIGGSSEEQALAIAIGPDGNAYVGGYTTSWDFPVVNAYQTTDRGWDGFVLRMNDTADGLDFSTRFGGEDMDVVRDVAVDATGAVYFTGETWSSSSFPIANAYQATTSEPSGWSPMNAFVAKLEADGSLASSTFLGGGDWDAGESIALDAAGNVFVSGFTMSSDFPVASAFQAAHAGEFDGFIVKLDASAGSLVYGTYLGGTGRDFAYDIAVDATGAVSVAGTTESADFPVANAFDGSFGGGGQDGFVARFAPGGASLAFGSYLGGSGFDSLPGLALDPRGNLFVAGYTESTDFPLSGSLMARGGADAVVMSFAPDGSLLESGAYGGTAREEAVSIARGVDGTLHLAGLTFSLDLPVAGAFQPDPYNLPDGQGGTEIPDIFMARIAEPTLGSWRGDYDGDGVDDVLWRNEATGQLTVWYSGVATDAQNLTRVINLDWRIVGIGDFDGDGASDLLWRNLRTGANTIWPAAHSGHALSVTGVSNTNWRVSGVGDFDGDGLDDILWHDVATGASAVWSAANSAAAFSLTRVANRAWDIVGTGDFDANGKADILWRNTATGQNAIWLDGNAQSLQPIGGVRGLDWQVAGIADFLGDGRDDVLWRNQRDGRNVVWRDGSSASGMALSGAAVRWRPVGTGDYDGDGRDDLLWRDTWYGINRIWRGSSAGSARIVRGITRPEWAVKS